MGTRVDDVWSEYAMLVAEGLTSWRYATAMASSGMMLPPAAQRRNQREADVARATLREAVILEGANVPCELVRDGGWVMDSREAERAYLRFVGANHGLTPREIRLALERLGMVEDDARAAFARLVDRGAIAVGSDMTVTVVARVEDGHG